MGRANLEQVRQVAHGRKTAGNLIEVGATVSSPQGAYTTPEMVALEGENLASMRHGQGGAESIAGAPQVRAWAAQARAAYRSTRSSRSNADRNRLGHRD